jgi:glutathione S-transferase
MKLFDYERAPNPRRARMIIAEKGIDVQKIPVDLYSKEQLSPEFLAINPGATLPVLETDDGTYLTETVAICLYLERHTPEPALMGTGATEEALVLNWNNIVEQGGFFAVAETLRNWSPGFRDHVFPGAVAYPQIPQLVDRGRQRMEQFFDRIEQRLSESPYLAGDNYSLADISLLAVTDFAGWVRVNPRKNRPALTRWHQIVSARPSAQA